MLHSILTRFHHTFLSKRKLYILLCIYLCCARPAYTPLFAANQANEISHYYLSQRASPKGFFKTCAVMVSSLMLLSCFKSPLTDNPSIEVLMVSPMKKTYPVANQNMEEILSINDPYSEPCPKINLSNLSFVTPEFRIMHFNHKFPPYLITDPGAGTMFTRLLIAYLTETPTGSIYDSPGLQYTHGFTGEGSCDIRLSAVQAHPNGLWLMRHQSIDFWTQGKMLLNGSAPCSDPDLSGERMRKVPLQYRPSIPWNRTASAIYVIRDPFDAAFSTYQLLQFKKSKYKNKLNSPHIHIIRNEEFNPAHFKNYMKNKFPEWNLTLSFIETHKKLIAEDRKSKANFVIIRYERLMSKSIKVRSEELMKLARFLIKTDKIEALKIKQKIQCWDRVLKDPRAQSLHRPKPLNTTAIVTKEKAFESLSIEFLCEIFQPIAPQAKKLGYQIWRNISCD